MRVSLMPAKLSMSSGQPLVAVMRSFTAHEVDLVRETLI